MRVFTDRAGALASDPWSFPWGTLVVAWAGSAALMAILWVVQTRRQNANWVDVGWAASLFGMAVGYGICESGSPSQRLLAGAIGGLWAGRLTSHLLIDRALGKPEDGRYGHLRSHWGSRADLHFIWFFQGQAVLATLLSIPFLLVATSATGSITVVQWAAVALFAAAIAGESVADQQLARWRADPANRGRTCRTGLWRYSRHPNYFFEWLIWCAFALLATPAPYGGWAWIAPVAMFVLITRVTGIPYTELQALRSRGEDYAAYQRTTSSFFPWFPRTDPKETDSQEMTRSSA